MHSAGLAGLGSGPVLREKPRAPCVPGSPSFPGPAGQPDHLGPRPASPPLAGSAETRALGGGQRGGGGGRQGHADIGGDRVMDGEGGAHWEGARRAPEAG